MSGHVGEDPTFAELDELAKDPESIGGALWTAAHQQGTFNWTIERDHHDMQPGRTISREAMDAVVMQMSAWVEARVMERWRRTGEPPTIIKISVHVDAQ